MALRDAWKGLFLKKNMPTQRPQGNEIGWSGNHIFSGIPSDEYNSTLAWPKSVAIYDQMRRSDGQVAAVLMALKLPIRSTEWFIDEDKDTDDSESALSDQIKEFVEDNLFGGMQYSWDDHLREALLMLDFGISVFETVWKYDTWNGRKAIMLDKYAPRVVTSLWRFPQDANYNIAGVEQINYMTGEIKTMPLNRCRVYTYNREGENPVGISALRPAYKHWYIKDALYKIVAIGIEKSLIGTPYANLPPGVSDDDRDKILNLLTATRVSDQAGFTIPDGVTPAMLESKKNPMDAMPFIEHQDTLIARSMLAQFINLGTMSSASGGSYALGNTMVDLFCMGLEGIATYIEGEVQKDIEKLVTWNFGPDAPMVYLHHKKIAFADVNQVAAALAALGSGHLLIPDEGVENRIRELFNLPPIPKIAMANQRMLPENRYVPDVVPDETTPGLQSAHQPGVPGQQTQQPPAQSANAQKKTVAAHEHSHGHMFDDTNGETLKPPGATLKPPGATKWRRDLTNWEKPVQFEDINTTWTNAENQYQDTVRQGLTQMTNSMLSQIQSIVDSSQTATQKTNAINALTANMSQKYVDTLVTQSQGLYTYGAGQVATELGVVATGTTAQADSAAIKAQVVTSVNSLVSNIVSKIKLYALSQLHRGVATKQLLFGTKQAATAFIDGGAVKTAGTITVSESINIGRGSEAKKIGIVGAQYSAILDSHTCPLCAELDMHQMSVDDPDFDIFRPPLHQNCRCILIYINKEEDNVEFNWKSPSGELVDHYGSLVK